MSAATHTTAPWHCAPTHAGQAWDIGAADGDNIALVRGSENDAANARLIAAAPDLLAALQNSRHAQTCWNRGPGACACGRDAAIAKALGEAL